MTQSYLFYSAERLLTLIKRDKNIITISDVVLKVEEELTRHSEKEIMANCIKNLEIMKKSVQNGLQIKQSRSGLIRDEAHKMNKMVEGKKMLQSPLEIKAAAWGLAVVGCTAIMGRTVAAPTAGSCGILPGCLLAMQEEFQYNDQEIARALLNSAGIGMIIAHTATFSAAKAGCQAEIGASSAMTASAISELRGMSPTQCVNAAALALKNMLGLACDPVAGLVEVPCVKRNAFGVSHAFMASDLSYAGIESVIPFDEVVVAMNNVANNMNEAIKETAMGGLAASKTGRKICAKLFKRL